MSVLEHHGPVPGAVIKGEQLESFRVMSAPWTPTLGHLEGAGRWWWDCPDCGQLFTADTSAVDLRCHGPEGQPHPRRTGLRPDVRVSAPASLSRVLLEQGTVDRIGTLAGALELATRHGAGEALTAAAAFLRLEHPHLASIADVLDERAELHRAGEL